MSHRIVACHKNGTWEVREIDIPVEDFNSFHDDLDEDICRWAAKNDPSSGDISHYFVLWGSGG